MFKTVTEAIAFAEALQQTVGPCGDREVVIAAPFTALSPMGRVLTVEGFHLAAQNFHWEEKGAFTGEISGRMLAEVGCRFVIVGHSERRQLFGETNETVNRKVLAAFHWDLVPILCVGEVLGEREEGKTFTVIGSQVERAIQGLSVDQAAMLVIAYEPVWAIGTGVTASPQQAQEVHAFIRGRIGRLCDKSIANGMRILYGGSVKADNVDALMAEPDLDGFLVGGASLEVASFKRIIQYQSS
jgi:triosephosphate isomerase